MGKNLKDNFRSTSMRCVFITIIFLFFAGSILGQQAAANLKITQLTGDFNVFTSYNYYKGSKLPANGMYVVTTEGVIMIDSPWDTTQFQPLLDSIKARHHKEVTLCIATHFHEDRTGGLEYYRQKNIKTYTTVLTDKLSSSNGKKRAEFLIKKDTTIKVGHYVLQTFYPGKGHAPDNIVIWFEKEKVLYGGCLVKSVEDTDLGNLSDASTKDYGTTIRKVMKKCKNPSYVIPGHYDWSSIYSLEHTLKMAQELK